MRLFILTLLILLTLTVEARERRTPAPLPLTSIHIIDRNGLSEQIHTKDRLEPYSKVDFLKPQPYQKVMRTYARNNKEEVLSLITSYYPNGQIKQYLELINNSAYGPYWEWYENGQHKINAFVIGGMGDLGPSSEKTWLFEGTTKAWNEDGTPACEIPYVKGIINGISTYYTSAGALEKKIPMKDGKIEGTLEKFGKDGVLLESMSYQNDMKNGESIVHYLDGTLAAKETYKEGLLINGRYYDKNQNLIATVDDSHGKEAKFLEGRLIELRTIVEGMPEGEVLQFDEEGNLSVKYGLKDGEKHGEEIEYYPAKKGKDPKPQLSVNWYFGKIQGVVKTWYPNGRQESKREMSDNKKNGLLSAWYEDGSIMMIEEYDQEILKKGSYFKRGDRTPISDVKEGRGTATFFDSQGNPVKKIQYEQGHPKE